MVPKFQHLQLNLFFINSQKSFGDFSKCSEWTLLFQVLSHLKISSNEIYKLPPEEEVQNI